jgi:hypothetical protein
LWPGRCCVMRALASWPSGQTADSGASSEAIGGAVLAVDRRSPARTE